MGFYIRKGFNFGPLRLNVSKSGLGFSFGIKGLRIGSGPSGNYIHAGRKGLYYKAKFSEIDCCDNDWLRISWPLIVLVILIVLLVYFYWQSQGDLIELKSSLFELFKQS